MASPSQRGIVGTVLSGWLCWLLLAAPAHAQPDSMPLTVLDNRDAAIRPDTQLVLPGHYVPKPQPVMAPGLPPPFEDSVPCPPLPSADIAMPDPQAPPPVAWTAPWTWQVLPDGLMFKNYLASNEEGRIGGQLYYQKNIGWTLDGILGGHAGLIRYGTQDPAWPEGWQLDVDGAALPRLDSTLSMVSTDFRIGIPLTRREGPWEFKFGYYHLSSHLGDMYLLSHPDDVVRLNYVRQQLLLGVAYRPVPDLRFYGEANWGYHVDGGSLPWEFQFGIDYSPVQPNGFYGSPFAAINTKIEQDLNYSGNVTVEAGWQWRGPTGHTLRTGLQFFDGMDFQRQFYNHYTQFIGVGTWYDF